MRHTLPLVAIVLTGLTLLLTGCAEPNPSAGAAPIAAGSERVAGLTTESELDRIATDLAGALRRAPTVARAPAPLHVTAPEWVNRTPATVDRPDRFVSTLTERVNERVGGNVQFVPVTPAASATRSDLASRVTLLPGRGGSTRRLRLRTELLSPNGDVAFAHEAEFAPVAGVSARERHATPRPEFVADRAAPRSRKPPLEPPPVQEESLADDGPAAQPVPPRGVVTAPAQRAAGAPVELQIADAELRDHLRVAKRLRMRSDGRLEVIARLTARGRASRQVAVQATFYDDAGRAIEQAAPQLRSLRPGRALSVSMKSRSAVRSCVVQIDPA